MMTVTFSRLTFMIHIMCREHFTKAFHSGIQLLRNVVKRDTVAWKINVRGIALVHRCTELVLTTMPYFFDAWNIRRT